MPEGYEHLQTKILNIVRKSQQYENYVTVTVNKNKRRLYTLLYSREHTYRRLYTNSLQIRKKGK